MTAKIPHMSNLLFPRSVEDLLNQFWQEASPSKSSCQTGSPTSSSKSSWTPRIDVVEKPDSYVVQVELPGVDPKDVSLTVNADSLTLAGAKQDAGPESAGDDAPKESPKAHVQERRFGEFSRTLTFPAAVSTEAVEATASHGILTITVGKAAVAQTRKIDIQEG